ncbi:MAG TPA: N-acyl homoserine lactonase family protein [Streptomyces sp.]|nr:N-acyl homoserine lactonase family protein [Streptomyces sp.]
MTKGPHEYEVLAVRYGTRQGTRSEIYLNHHIYGEADTPLGMDYYLWVVRGEGRTVVVDTGFGPEGGARRKRTTLVEPVEALAGLGIDAASVEQVVVTHAHYDHIGNLAEFRAAEVVMARREYEFWTGPYGARRQFLWSIEESEVAHLSVVREEERLTLIDKARTIAPGIEVVPVGGHTPGQVVVLVATPGGGTAVLASDSAHYYEELDLDRPFAFVADLEAMYRGFDLLNDLARTPGHVLVPGHDPEVMRRFPSFEGLAPGLAVRISRPPVPQAGREDRARSRSE